MEDASIAQLEPDFCSDRVLKILAIIPSKLFKALVLLSIWSCLLCTVERMVFFCFFFLAFVRFIHLPKVLLGSLTIE